MLPNNVHLCAVMMAAALLLPTPEAFSPRITIARSFSRLTSQSRYPHSSAVFLSQRQEESDTTTTEEDEAEEGAYAIDEEENCSIYDITCQWKAAKEEASEFWKNVVFSENNNDHQDNKDKDDNSVPTHPEKSELKQEEDAVIDEIKSHSGKETVQKHESQSEDEKTLLDPLKNLLADNNGEQEETQDAKPKRRKSFKDAANHFAGLLTSKGGGGEQSIRDIVDTARESAEEGEVSDQKSFQEVLDLLRQYSGELKSTAGKYFGTIDFSQIYPTSLFYFIEYEDERKNPSWKRRVHRFHPGIKFSKINELNDALALARLSYYESSDDVRQRLNNLSTPYELVWCDLRADEPGKPAHYLAVKKNQNPLSPALELVLGVRGTKTLTDAITDLLFEPTDYRGGKAHSGFLSSGQYIAEKHKELLQNLLDSSGKKRIKLSCVGHSLGAGAATIAAMEFNDMDFIEPQVVGFGSPALLSQELSEQMGAYVTTVVSDDDCVPRLSAPTVLNALLDLQEFNYVPRAKRDIEHAVSSLSKMYPLIVPEDAKGKVLDLIDPLLNEHVVPTIHNTTDKRMEVELYPPGKVIHFYKDGTGISGNIVPCTFFDQLDIKRRMVLDHLFHSGYEQTFLDIMRYHYKDHYFQFENPVTVPPPSSAEKNNGDGSDDDDDDDGTR